MLVDDGFEAKLIERIALKEAIAKCLDERQRKVLYAWLRGYSYGEIGAQQPRQVSRESIRRIVDKATRRLKRPSVWGFEPQAVKPQQATCDTPPVGFDKAAFLKHMRHLIGRRDKERAEAEERKRRLEIAAKQRAWQLEVAAMDRFLELATPKAPPTPPVHPRYEPPPRPPPAPLPPVQPWHEVYPQPKVSQYQLTVCAFDVIGELARQWPITGVRQRGWVGHQTSIVKFHPFHSIKDAIARMLSTVPSGAVFSTVALPIPNGMRGAVAETESFAVRVLISDDDQVLRFDVTWDHPPTD